MKKKSTKARGNGNTIANAAVPNGPARPRTRREPSGGAASALGDLTEMIVAVVDVSGMMTIKEQERNSVNAIVEDARVWFASACELLVRLDTEGHKHGYPVTELRDDLRNLHHSVRKLCA